MSATTSYKIDSITFNNLKLSAGEYFAIARALRARVEMLMGMLSDLDLTYSAETATARAYLLRQLESARSARDQFDRIGSR